MEKAKRALEGFAVEINSNEEAMNLLDEISEILNKNFTGEEVIKLATKSTEGVEIKYLSVNRFCGMELIALAMITDEEKETLDILDKRGVLAYVYNATYPNHSELGYSFYRDYDEGIVRVG